MMLKKDSIAAFSGEGFRLFRASSERIEAFSNPNVVTYTLNSNPLIGLTNGVFHLSFNVRTLGIRQIFAQFGQTTNFGHGFRIGMNASNQLIFFGLGVHPEPALIFTLNRFTVQANTLYEITCLLSTTNFMGLQVVINGVVYTEGDGLTRSGSGINNSGYTGASIAKTDAILVGCEGTGSTSTGSNGRTNFADITVFECFLLVSNFSYSLNQCKKINNGVNGSLKETISAYNQSGKNNVVVHLRFRSSTYNNKVMGVPISNTFTATFISSATPDPQTRFRKRHKNLIHG